MVIVYGKCDRCGVTDWTRALGDELICTVCWALRAGFTDSRQVNSLWDDFLVWRDTIAQRPRR